MRVLSQQITLLSRSLGNLLIPMLSAVVPYAIAFVKVLRMAVDAIASFFGVTLPTIDYDSFGDMSVGIDDTAGSVGDLEDSLGGAAKEAKKLLYLIGGFDELNVLPSQSDPSSGSGGSGGVGGGAGFDGLELPSYDFLDGLSDQVDVLIPKMQELLKWIAAIGAAFLVWKGIEAIANLGDWFTKLSPLAQTMVKTLAGLAAALAGVVIYVKSFTNAWENGVDWKNLIGMVGGAALAMAGLSLAISPLVGGLVGLAGGLGIIIVAFRDMAKNGANLKNVSALIAGVGVSIAGVITANKKWKSVLRPLTSAVDAFKYGFSGLSKNVANGVPLFKAFGTSLKDTRKYFDEVAGPGAKAAVAIAGVAVVATTTYLVVKDLALSVMAGSASFGDFAKAGLILAPVLAAVGVAMYAALGPLGLVITAVAAVGAAVVAVAVATAELDEQMAVAAVFSPNGGVPVQAIADQFIELTDSINAASEAITVNKTEMDNLSTSIELGTERVLNLTTANYSTLEEAQVVLPLLAQEYEQLSSDIIRNIELAEQTLQTALVQMPQEAYNQAQTTMPALATVVSSAATGMTEEILNLNAEFADLLSQLESDPNNQALKDSLSDVGGRLAELGGTSITMADDYSTAIDGMMPVDFSALVDPNDIDATQQNLTGLVDSITRAGSDAQANLAVAQEEIMKSMDALTEGMNPADAQALRDTFAAAFELESGRIMEQQNVALEQIRGGFQQEIDKFAETVDPNQMDKIFAVMFGDTAQNQATLRVNRMFSDVFSAIDTAEATSKTSQDVIDGIAEGIRRGDASQVTRLAKQLGTDATDAVAEGAGTASPSKYTTETGLNIVQGLVGGISKNQNASTNAARKAAESVVEIFQKTLAVDKMRPFGKTIIEGISAGVSQSQQTLESTVSAVTDTINTKFQTGLASDKTTPYGRNAVQGIQRGIQQNRSLVIDAATTLAEGTLQKFQQILSNSRGQQYGRELMGGIASGISQTNYSLEWAMSNVGQQLSSALSNIIRDLQRQAAASPINIQITTTQTINTVRNSGSTRYSGLRFASGGVISKPTYGLMGEYPGANSNPEIVAPQSMLIESVQAANEMGNATMVGLLTRIATAVENNENISINIDGQELATSVNTSNQKLNKVTGRVG